VASGIFSDFAILLLYYKAFGDSRNFAAGFVKIIMTIFFLCLIS